MSTTPVGMRERCAVAIVPGAPVLLQQYASLEDPVAELRRASLWAGTHVGASPRVLADSEQGRRIAAELLPEADGDLAGILVIANGSARRTEKAPGHLDERSHPFDAAIAEALAAGDMASLATTDLALADELLATGLAAFQTLASEGWEFERLQVTYEDDPFGVMYWVASGEMSRPCDS